MKLVRPSQFLSDAIAVLEREAPKLALRVKTFVADQDDLYHERCQAFLFCYVRFLEEQNLSFDEGVGSFIRLQSIVETERQKFLATAQYPNTSFKEVNNHFYSNPELMRHHMHGLVFAQFLWPDQYQRFCFFSDHLKEFASTASSYLEVGGGHALYLCEAQRQIGSHASIEVVDISETSMNMVKSFSAGSGSEIRYHLMDIFDLPDAPVFDFITMGEVLEHVEEPAKLLNKLRCLLHSQGRVYITTPANAPMPDHIYLFHNADEIRAMLTSCGFRIEKETFRYAIDVPPKIAEKLKLPLMYAAFCSTN